VKRPAKRSLFLFKEGGRRMDEELTDFMIEHDCEYCLYFLKACRAIDRCVFDHLPPEWPDEDIEMFFV
jgi:hypothetical protein